ncbi:MAG: hypothetical protein M1300_07435 [Epsilonproteobacteria bacterium]|nr:hypothetical protein [Campylobacterota bacterium]
MYVGRVTIDDLSDTKTTLKVKVNKKIVRVAISAEDSENLTLLEQYYLYVVDLYDKGEGRGFKVLPSLYEEENTQNKRILFILKASDTEDSYDLSIDESSNDEHFDFILDGFFQGEYHYEVQDSAESLLKRYDPKGNGKIIAIIAVTISVLLISLYIWSVFEDMKRAAAEAAAEAEKVKKEQEQVVVPLKPEEINVLKSIVSRELLDQFKKDVLRIKENDRLDSHVSIRSVTTNYEVQSDILKLKGVIGYEYDYPVNGTTLASELVYTNTKDYQIQKSRSELYLGNDSSLTVSCVKSAIEMPADEKVVLERKAGVIKIKYTKIRPADLFYKFRPYMDACPVYIDNAAISEGKFDIQLTLYKGDE